MLRLHLDFESTRVRGRLQVCNGYLHVMVVVAIKVGGLAFEPDEGRGQGSKASRARLSQPCSIVLATLQGQLLRVPADTIECQSCFKYRLEQLRFQRPGSGSHWRLTHLSFSLSCH
jgi:hypothetical protein